MVNGTLTLSGTHEVISTTPKHFQAGSLSIVDPGWAYQVLVFVDLQGAATEAPQAATPWIGTGNYGKILVLGPADKVYAEGVSTGNDRNDFTQAVPYAALNAQPATLTGDLNLDLWLSLWSGTTYTFTSADARFYALVMPAI